MGDRVTIGEIDWLARVAADATGGGTWIQRGSRDGVDWCHTRTGTELGDEWQIIAYLMGVVDGAGIADEMTVRSGKWARLRADMHDHSGPALVRQWYQRGVVDGHRSRCTGTRVCRGCGQAIAAGAARSVMAGDAKVVVHDGAVTMALSRHAGCAADARGDGG